MDNKSINAASFYYSVNMLKTLYNMKLLTKEEYNRILSICAEHYDIKIIYGILF